MTDYQISELPEPISSRIQVNIETGCWEWQGARGIGGYGRIYWQRKTLLTHRLVYTLLVGPIPDGLEIDHVKIRGCQSTACCWPAHLEPVTPAENVHRSDRATGTRHRHGRRTHCAQGHEYTPENTRVRSDSGRRCRACDRARRVAINGPEARRVAINGPEARRVAINGPEARRLSTPVVPKTHCPAGHEYSPDNTYRSSDGKRTCRACNREAVRRYKARKQPEARP